MTTATTLVDLSACELRREIGHQHVSAREVVEVHLARIEAVNPKLNAIVTVVADHARAAAAAADEAQAQGRELGLLHGLPTVHKDLFVTAGVRTTFGSPVFADHVPAETALIVQRERAAGAISLGKTNTPELGAGSQTFNTVFGATANPYAIDRTCGGSSGGSAVALATCMASLADGSDLGGSLRNPASFCNVVGLRPTPGRVPRWPNPAPRFPFNVHGPMGRTVADVALLLDAISGPDSRDPLSREWPAAPVSGQLERDLTDVRVAWSQTLGGLPVEPAVLTALAPVRQQLEELGCVTEEAEPDLSGADDIFVIWRAWYFELAFGDLLDRHRDQLKDTVVWNIEAGRALTGPQLGAAERLRTALDERCRKFQEQFPFLVLPVCQVVPFPIDQPYVTQSNDVARDTYLDWMKSCYHISVTGLPAVSVPAGFTPDGLPVGLQVVGRPGDELGVLQLAHAIEQATGTSLRRPVLEYSS